MTTHALPAPNALGRWRFEGKLFLGVFDEEGILMARWIDGAAAEMDITLDNDFELCAVDSKGNKYKADDLVGKWEPVRLDGDAESLRMALYTRSRIPLVHEQPASVAIHMTRANYPNPGRYVEQWRRAKKLPDEGYTIGRKPLFFGMEGHAIKREFVDALHRRINARGKLNRSGRRWQESYQIDLLRDQIDLQALVRGRVIVRQFRTELVHRRFGHLQKLAAKEDRRRKWHSKRKIRIVAYQRIVAQRGMKE